MKARTTIFILDKHEAAHATSLFGEAPVERTNPLRVIVVLLLLAIAALAAIGVAFAADGADTWRGSTGDLQLTLRYDPAKAVLRIDGPDYDCTLTAAKPRRSGTRTSSSITDSTGGRCDRILGHTMEIDDRAGEGRQLAIKDREGELELEATLKPR